MDIDAFKIPNPFGPTCKISCANTDNKATAPPNKTAIMSKDNAPKIALLLNTNLSPTFKLSFTDSPILGFKIGFFFI